MRTFGLQDIVSLFRYRSQVMSLDSVWQATHGAPLGPLSILEHLNPGRGGFIGVTDGEDDAPSLLGQVHLDQGSSTAHLGYIMPAEAVDSAALNDLLDGLAKQAGCMGALSLLAEVEEDSPVFMRLRRSGFSVYGWQRIWRLPFDTDPAECLGRWEDCRLVDSIAVRSLYHSLVPPLVQRADPLPPNLLHGLIYREGGEVMGYMDASYGPHGICLRPLVHPAAEDVAGLLARLPFCYPPLLGRPVCLVVRSYQAWLEATLEQLGAEVAPRQALMVNHLARFQRAAFPASLRPLYETGATETTFPVAHLNINDN
jgi:hypothetical protein